MNFYELTLIARNDVSQSQVEALVDSIEACLKEGKGEILKKEFWGLRQLAYKIKKNSKGHYVFLGIKAPVEAMNEVERRLSLNEDVLRHLTLRVEEIDEEPTLMLQRKNEDQNRPERGSRGPRQQSGGRYESGRAHRPAASAAPAPAAEESEGE